MHVGEFELEATAWGVFVVKGGDGVAKDTLALPAYRVYGDAGLMPGSAGVATLLDAQSITGATQATPIVLEVPNHQRASGELVVVAGVMGNNAANGTWVITALDADHFALNASVGNGVYFGGGEVHTAGAYQFSFPVSAVGGFAAGKLYTILVAGETGGGWAGVELTFRVI